MFIGVVSVVLLEARAELSEAHLLKANEFKVYSLCMVLSLGF